MLDDVQRNVTCLMASVSILLKLVTFYRLVTSFYHRLRQCQARLTNLASIFFVIQNTISPVSTVESTRQLCRNAVFERRFLIARKIEILKAGNHSFRMVLAAIRNTQGPLQNPACSFHYVSAVEPKIVPAISMMMQEKSSAVSL
jgi:hypothetical protein